MAASGRNRSLRHYWQRGDGWVSKMHLNRFSAHILRLSSRDGWATAAVVGAAVIHTYSERLRLGLGHLFNLFHVPGAIRDTWFRDKVSGRQISVSVGRRFVRVTIDEREYFF